jgi:uncharacterized membrane protein
VLQTAATQLSPRVTRTFLRDRFNQAVLGLFVATFVFSLLVLVAVSDEHVPQLAVLAALGSVLLAVLAFVAYLDHMAHAIRPTTVIEAIASETRTVIAAIYPGADGQDDLLPTEPLPATPSAGRVVAWSGASGYVQGLDSAAFRRFAEREGGRTELSVGIGAFLGHGRPLLRLPNQEGPPVTAADAGLEESVRVGEERTMAEDPAFGFRQLVDIALRALSPSLNDPSTAIQVIDRLDELLEDLQRRDIPAPMVLWGDARSKVIVPAPDWDAYVSLATFEIGQACQALPQVQRHLRAVLEAHLRRARDARQPALRRALAEIDRSTAGSHAAH